MNKEEEEAEMIINEYYLSPLSINKADSIECAIIHVEGIIKELKEYVNSISGYSGLKMKGRITNLNRVLTILNNK